jgi:hypothetical protein
VGSLSGVRRIDESLLATIERLREKEPEKAEKLAHAIYAAQRRHPSSRAA